MGIARMFRRSFGHRPDYIIIGAGLFLVLIGFLFLSSASSDLAKIKYNDTYYFLKHQIVNGFFPGLLGFFVGMGIYYRRWKKFAPLLLLLNLVLLILVFTPLGYEAHGANRWVQLGPISFQPSEFLKITFVLYLASLLSSASLRNKKKGWETYWIFLLVSGVVAGLILIQPATTMVVIIVGAGAIMYFFSGASFKHLALTVLLGVVLIGLLAIATPYRLHRIAPFWNSIAQNVAPMFVLEGVEADRFHVNQSLTSIGTGGLFGVGFGKSTSKYSVLPEPMGDSIFSVIAEEVGFVGSVLVLGSYLLLFWRSTALVKNSHDDFARLFVLGFISIIMIQTTIHVAANSGLLPFTGVPLPFISYGGTSLAVSMTMLGIMAGVSKHANY